MTEAIGNRKNGFQVLWNSLKETFQKDYLKPNSRQPQEKPYRLSKANLKRLGFYQVESSNQYIVAPSARFSESYYDTFELKPVPSLNKVPFLLKLTEEEIGRFALSQTSNNAVSPTIINEAVRDPRSKKHEVLIEYNYSENDSLIVYNRLTDLDKHILLFIGTFRNVQFAQIVRETGESASNVEKSLKRLLTYCLIQHFHFHRDPVIVGEERAELEGDCYSILAYGTNLLLINNVITAEVAHKWREMTFYEDSFTPIRHWKIVDAYLDFRVKDDFVGFQPYSYMDSFTMEVEKELPQWQNVTKTPEHMSEQSKRMLSELQKKQPQQKAKPKTRLVRGVKKVRRVRFDGQIQLQNASGTRIYIDLYPFITAGDERSDLSRLTEIFLHFGHLDNGVNKHGEKHFLMIIVDSEDQIKLIEDKFRLADNYKGMRQIMFLDLAEASEKNVGSAMKVLVIDPNSKSSKLKTAKFTIDDALLNQQPKTNKNKVEVTE